MCYEIAFYNVFDTGTEFEEMCNSYISYIPESFRYHSITFYGIGADGDFEYTLRAEYGNPLREASPFDSKSFKRYKTDSDTHKYWEYIR